MNDPRVHKTRDGYSFQTPGSRVRLTHSQVEECRMWMNESGIDERDHMRYLRDSAARYGDPLVYVRAWGEYYRRKAASLSQEGAPE